MNRPMLTTQQVYEIVRKCPKKEIKLVVTDGGPEPISIHNLTFFGVDGDNLTYERLKNVLVDDFDLLGNFYYTRYIELDYGFDGEYKPPHCHLYGQRYYLIPDSDHHLPVFTNWAYRMIYLMPQKEKTIDFRFSNVLL